MWRGRARVAEDMPQRRYEQGLPNHHDPLAGIGGAPPAQSALTLRLVLAIFGLVVCIIAAVVCLIVRLSTAISVVLIVLAVIAAGDIAVVTYRKRRGEPG